MPERDPAFLAQAQAMLRQHQAAESVRQLCLPETQRLTSSRESVDSQPDGRALRVHLVRYIRVISVAGGIANRRSELLRLGRSVRTVPPAGQTTCKQADGRDRKRIVIFVGVIRDRRAAREATVEGHRQRVGHTRRTGSRGPWLHDS
jgi:hypothetical protein